MSTRRNFLGRAAALAALGMPVPTEADEPAPPQSLRDITTVRHGDVLSDDLEALFLDGKKMEGTTAFNVKEGWVDAYTLKDGRPVRPFEHLRHFGVVTYTLKPWPRKAQAAP